MDKDFVSYKMEERSYASYIKREIHQQVARLTFTATEAAEIDLIVSEISSNLIKHAGSGELLFRIQEGTDRAPVFEIISIDKGPGIPDTTRAMRDGISTTHTLGHGLGSINRMSNLSQLYSIPGWGTILYAMKTANRKGTAGALHSPEIRGLCVTKPRETVCGDGYCVKRTGSDTSIFFADGLGHGAHAHEAVARATEFFFECRETDPVTLLRLMHGRVRKTRGLVGTVAVYSAKNREWRMCGVGNILTKMQSGVEVKHYMPYNGAVGLNLPHTMNTSVFPAMTNQLLIMCSDGIRTRWELNRYPSILKYDPTVLAAALYKDFSRGTDDASVLIAKIL